MEEEVKKYKMVGHGRECCPNCLVAKVVACLSIAQMVSVPSPNQKPGI